MSFEYNATVTKRVNIASETMVLRVKLDGEPLAFEPGQYTVLGLLPSSSRIAEAPPDSPGLKASQLLRRAYSITSNSNEDELEFVITLIRSGALTPRLFNLQQGSRLYVEPKATGAFTLKKSSGNRDLLLVATSSAVAPYLSMLRTTFPEAGEHQYVVVHAAASSWDLAFRAQLEALAAQSKHLTYLPTISEPAQDKQWQGLIGTAEQLLKAGEIEDALGLTIEPDRFDVFLAGNPQMIDAVSQILEERGFKYGPPDDPETNIHLERYW